MLSKIFRTGTALTIRGAAPFCSKKDMSTGRIGQISQVIGAVVDVQF